MKLKNKIAVLTMGMAMLSTASLSFAVANADQSLPVNMVYTPVEVQMAMGRPMPSISANVTISPLNTFANNITHVFQVAQEFNAGTNVPQRAVVLVAAKNQIPTGQLQINAAVTFADDPNNVVKFNFSYALSSGQFTASDTRQRSYKGRHACTIRASADPANNYPLLVISCAY